jgi:hypothetical protein
LGICTIAVFLFFASGFVFAQNQDGIAGVPSRSLVPEDLLRPRREESPRYAVDPVIGPLGQGTASKEAYQFAGEVAAALLAKNKDAKSLGAMNRVSLEGFLSALEQIGPRNFRLGGGRMEDDGAVSFLVRFIGREQAITGELFIRPEESRTDEDKPVQAVWIFEDLILEDVQNREDEIKSVEQRFDFSPYHRFF